MGNHCRIHRATCNRSSRPRAAVDRRKHHTGIQTDKLIVRYDPAVCIHVGECVRGLPSVFNLSKKPWIDVNGASPAAIVDQVKLCPSGALTYELLKDTP